MVVDEFDLRPLYNPVVVVGEYIDLGMVHIPTKEIKKFLKDNNISTTRVSRMIGEKDHWVKNHLREYTYSTKLSVSDFKRLYIALKEVGYDVGKSIVHIYGENNFLPAYYTAEEVLEAIENGAVYAWNVEPTDEDIKRLVKGISICMYNVKCSSDDREYQAKEFNKADLFIECLNSMIDNINLNL